MSKESFKSFVRSNPSLASYVNNKKMSWQNFYEMYELYGENSNVWDNYKEEFKSIMNNIDTKPTVGFKDVFNVIKQMDLEEVQKGIGSLQKGISFIQGLVKENNTSKIEKDAYEPRPMYKYFDD